MQKQREYFQQRTENSKQLNVNLIKEVARLNRLNRQLKAENQQLKGNILYLKRLY